MDNYPIAVFPTNLECGLVELARFDLSNADGVRIAEMCGDALTNLQAMDKTGTLEAKSLGDHCVYIFSCGGDGPCKIGVSENPIKRLSSVQTGCPQQLYVSHVFWMPRAHALKLEKLALDIYDYQGHRATGEWINLGPKRVAEMLGGLLEGANAQVSNSAMFKQNLRNIERLSGDLDDYTTRGRGRVSPEEVIIDRLS